MQDLIAKIEQWAHDRNIINGCQPIDQAMKLFSEFGELADNVGKGRDCRDDIGDVFVVMTIIKAQLGYSIKTDIETSLYNSNDEIKSLVAWLGFGISDAITDNVGYGDHISWETEIAYLRRIADLSGSNLEECVQIAYNDIKDRKGQMVNGVFIKEGDVAK